MGLTNGQQRALSEVKKGNNVFITGGGGVGKSYIVNYIVTELQSAGKIVMVTASTGKAATLIGGVTCHRAFQIPIKGAWQSEPHIQKNSPIYTADVILIDEVSMLRIDSFEYIIKSVDKVNEIRRANDGNPIQLIVVGDFCQLPPVIVHPNDGSPDEGDMMSEYFGFDVGQGYAFTAPGWKRCNFKICELTEVLRQSDKPMIDALNGIRLGDHSALSYFVSNKRKRKFSAKTEDVVYLCGKNKTAERINNTALAHLSGKTHEYYSHCVGTVSDQDKQAPDLIKLKLGAHVIMLQNTEKYRNGSSGTVTEMHDDSVSILIHETGEEIDVPYTTWDIERYVIKEALGKKKLEKEKIGSYSQLPLRLGYAITIHKSQGQTFEKVVLILGSDDKKKNAKSTRPEIFAFGQLYVALSRVKSMEGLYIEGNLNLVDILAAPEVIKFYRASESSITLLTSPEQANPIKKRKASTSTSSAENFKVIHCTAKTVSLAWVFAKALSSKSTLSGTDIHIPEKYSDQAEKFINSLPK